MIRLVKMDGAANDSPLDSISWDGFPSLFYIRAGSKDIVPYTGGRDEEGIISFIVGHHSKKDKIAAKLGAEPSHVGEEESVVEGGEEEEEEGEL